MQLISKVLGLVIVILLLASCNRKIDQSNMFSGRSHATKKKGIYDAGLNAKKPMSVQLKKEYDKQTKHDANPKKAAKLANKDLEKKKKAMAKKTAKFQKKKKLGVKPGKTKTGGDK